MNINLKNSVLLLLVFTFCLLSIPAMGAERQVVRVAYPYQEGLTECDDEGNYSGYTYEYLLEIAQYTGWEYEFVQIPGQIDESLTVMMEMLEHGELDLMGGIMYSEELAKIYDFAGYSYGTVYTVLHVPYEDAATAVIDSSRNHNLRVAVLPSMSRRMQELKDYCTLNNIEAELVYCRDEEDLFLAVADGRADAILDVSLNQRQDMRQIARFAPRPFYFVTTRGNRQMIQEINRAIVSMEQMDPYFSTMLYEKYFMAESEAIILSDEEREYLESSPVIRVGYRVDAPPFQYMDETGQPSGIAVGVLRDVARRTGLQFEYVPVENREALSDMMEDLSVDMVAAFVYDYEASRQSRIAMTRPYVTTQFVMAVLDKKTADTRGGREGLVVLPEYAGIFPDARVMDSTEECLREVMDGSVLGAYGNSYTIQYYLNRPEYSEIRLFSQEDQEFRMSFGVLMPGRTELLSILNKAVISLKEEDVKDILYQNILYSQKSTVLQIIRQNPIEAILITSIFLLCVILLLTWVLSSRINMNRKLALNLRRYQEVFGLSSDHLLEYNYGTEKLTVANPSGIPGGGLAGNQIYHLTAEKYDEKTWGDSSHEEVVNILLSPEEGSREVYTKCPDGNYHWLRITMRLLCDENGKPAYKLGKVANIDRERQEREELMARAAKDGLTRLFNADHARRMVKEALQARKAGQCCALLLLDVDYFKQINDTFGHPEGDRVLEAVAGILSGYAGAGGIAGRIGGDEFILFLPEIAEPEALDETCRSLCRDMRGCHLGEEKVLSVSVGAAVAGEEESFEELYQRVDEILYLAKRNGRDRYELGQ